MKRIALLGGGKMAEAIIRRLISSGRCRAEEIVVSDVDGVRLETLQERYGVMTTGENREAASGSESIILAVKPQNLEEVLQDIAGSVGPGQTVISIAMGKDISFIEERLPEGTPVIRVMPNNPAMVGFAVSVLSYGRNVGERERALALDIFRTLGDVHEVEEKYQDAAMALSGCGPAYFYLIADALGDAGVKLGLDRRLALDLVAGAMLGAAMMMREFPGEPARLKDMVTSPGGSTIMALEALEEGGVRAAFFRAVEAAYRRAREV